MARRLKFNIFRYNPQDPDSSPHTDTFHLEETESMSLFIALNQIREEQDPSYSSTSAVAPAYVGPVP